MLLCELAAAEETLLVSVSITRSLAWNAFLPWPELQLARQTAGCGPALIAAGDGREEAARRR